ncbi:hypothetical protein [Microvirga terrestris]|uniref:Uncharacterized protein n=1 Tax=Microvirga terrestris TaxID=2791024 RepID=A0ABS0HPG4_9HYPH|nr:hypothetical protein [Microvirga terrestris]MBF9195095.1 hypothetical protein [Microvirga terrestris]
MVDNPEELIARARADLAKQEMAEVRALEALEKAREEQIKLRGFIETLERYLGINSASIPFAKSQARGSRSRDIVDKAVELLFLKKRPLEIAALADLIEIDGLSIAGQNRNATLAGYLSRDDRVEFVRGAGWQLTITGIRSMGAEHASRSAPSLSSNPQSDQVSSGFDDLDEDIPF